MPATKLFMQSRFSLFSILLFASFVSLAIFQAPLAMAASCCGGGFASPSIITGDERTTLSTELSYSNIATEVTSGGLWQSRSSPESLETFRLQGAQIFLDRFQIGGGLPVVRRSRSGSNSSGLGDLGLNLGYEILPEFEYSEWRPRGVSYVTFIAPTGRSIQEATDSLQLDSRGRGFWAVGFGTTLTKVIAKFDFVTSIEGHRSFAKEIKTASLEGELIPGFGAAWSLGAGYNLKDTRFGASLAFSYEDAVETRGTIASAGAPARFATVTLVASQMFAENWSAAIAVSDQMLFGAPTNTTLARTVTATLQRRFLR